MILVLVFLLEKKKNLLVKKQSFVYLQKPKHCKHIYISLQFANYNMLLGLLGWSQAKCVEEFFLNTKDMELLMKWLSNSINIERNKYYNKTYALKGGQKWESGWWMYNYFDDTMQHTMGVEWTKCCLVISTIELIAYTSYFEPCWRNLQLQKIFDKLQELHNQAQKRHDFFTHECWIKIWSNYNFNNYTHLNFDSDSKFLLGFLWLLWSN